MLCRLLFVVAIMPTGFLRFRRVGAMSPRASSRADMTELSLLLWL